MERGADKRTAAYADIFGRPSPNHHQYPRPPPSTSVHSMQGYGAPPATYDSQAYYYQQYAMQRQQYAAHYDTQSMYGHATSQYNAAQFQQTYPQAYHQGVYAPQQQHSHSSYPQESYTQLSIPEQQYQSSRASSSRSAGVIAPRPQEPADPSLEAYTRAGLTPAQAYQAHVNRSSPMRYGIPSSEHLVSDTQYFESRPLSGTQEHQVPQLGFEPPSARLDLDFMADGRSRSSQDVAEPDSTLSTSPHSQQDAFLPDGSAEYKSSRPYPLMLDTAALSAARALEGNSPASSTYVEQVSASPSSPRRSSESSRTMPRAAVMRRERTLQERSRSMSATTAQASQMIQDLRTSPRPSMPSFHSPPNGSPQPHHSHSRRTPIVYPALLSRVAEAFRERITASERVKDGLSYTDVFDGREAVDKIAYIIKTTDRNLALLLGRALDAQKFFHDVTYDHRLRDSPYELYRFRIAMPTLSGELVDGESRKDSTGQADTESGEGNGQVQGDDASSSQITIPNPSALSADEVPLPSGVFTLLTDCYSPTCSRDSLCYSIACPRRLEQQARLNMKPQPGLKRTISKESLGDLVEPGTLWIHSVPKEIVDSVSETEKKRQEAINEVIYTERDFVRDMEYLRDVWISRLKTSDVIPEARRLDFLEQVFWNVHDIIAVNSKLRDALNKRQKSFAIVERIGDILLEHVTQFAPFVSYGSHQLYGKYEFEKEKSNNLRFQKLVDEIERLPESRKLELNGYLTKPVTRLARYPLLLDVVAKYTPEDNPDKKEIPKAIEVVKDFLAKVNVETGKTANRFNLLQLDQQLVFRTGEEVDLRLTEEGRELIYKGNLKKRGGAQGDGGDLQLFLFDHALLMVKQKEKHKHEMHKVYRRPIPLELLLVCAPDEPRDSRQLAKTVASKTLTKRSSFNNKNLPPAPPIIVPVKGNVKDGFALTFVHLGRKYYQLTLYANTLQSRKKWLEMIHNQQEVMRERSLVFDTVTISEGFFTGPMIRVNCAAPFEQGRRIAYGTSDGIYFSDSRNVSRPPVRVLALQDVTQIDVLEEYQLLIVLSDGAVITFPMEALSEHDANAGLRRAKRIASHTTFFKAGICLGKTLVCVVKASQLSSTIKALEPIDFSVRGKSKPTFKKLIQGGHDTLRLFREFYIPVESSSIHYLKTKLCVGCTKGFEIVDLETLDTQALLDPADSTLDFVQKRDDVRPMAIYRIENDFLLCYDEFAFYVNKSGWRARSWFMVYWEGHPKSFALHYPYVLAFDPTFVEVRHVETGAMAQVIQGNNLRCLFAEAPPSTTHSKANLYNNGHNGYGPRVPDPRQSLYSNRSSIVSSSSSSNMYHGQNYGGSYPVYPDQRQGPMNRSEILMISDDRIMSLRISEAAQRESLSYIQR